MLKYLSDMTFSRPNVKDGERYSVKETCYHLGVCRDSLSKYTNEGRIPRYRHASGRYFYLGQDILAFFDNLDDAGELTATRGRKPSKK